MVCGIIVITIIVMVCGRQSVGKVVGQARVVEAVKTAGGLLQRRMDTYIVMAQIVMACRRLREGDHNGQSTRPRASHVDMLQTLATHRSTM